MTELRPPVGLRGGAARPPSRSAPEPRCSFRSATTCWTLAARFPVRAGAGARPRRFDSAPRCSRARGSSPYRSEPRIPARSGDPPLTGRGSTTWFQRAKRSSGSATATCDSPPASGATIAPRRPRPASRAHDRAAALRHHPRLLGFAGAGRDRVRSGAGRSVRHPGGRQHRRAVAGGQRGVRGRALRHPAGRGAGPLAVRRDRGHAGGAAPARPRTSRATCGRSWIACGRRSRDCSRPTCGTTRPRWCGRRCAPTSARRSNHLRHGSELLEQLIQDEGLWVVGAEYSLETGIVEFFDVPPQGPLARGLIGMTRSASADLLVYALPGGWEVLVGRSERANDHLSLELARPGDLWFHIRGHAREPRGAPRPGRGPAGPSDPGAGRGHRGVSQQGPARRDRGRCRARRRAMCRSRAGPSPAPWRSGRRRSSRCGR